MPIDPYSSSSASGSGEANTSSNLGAGEGLASAKVGVDLPFKSIVAGTGMNVSSDADTVTLTAIGGVGSDEKVSISANDTTVGFLGDKLVAGTDISLTEVNDGGSETLLADLTVSAKESIVVANELEASGVVGSSDIFSIGSPTSGVDYTEVNYYISGVRYTLPEATGVNPEFAVGSSAKYFGVDNTEVLLKYDTPVTTALMEAGVLPIGSAFADGLGAGPGSAITSVGQSKPIYSAFNKSIDIYWRDMVGSVFQNGFGAVTQNAGNTLGVDQVAPIGYDSFKAKFTLSGSVLPTMQVLLSTAVIGTPSNVFNTSVYDDGAGGFTTMSNPNRFGFAEVYTSSRTGTIFQIYGRAEYTSFEEARDAVSDITGLAVPVNDDDEYIYTARAVFKRGSVDLSTSGDSALVDTRPVFIGTNVNSAAAHVSTYNDIYLNTASGLTQITDRSVKWRAAIGLNTAVVMEWQNDAGTATAYIKGNGISYLKKLSINRASDPTGAFDIRGLGTTSATQAMYVRDSANLNIYSIGDDGSTYQTGDIDFDAKPHTIGASIGANTLKLGGATSVIEVDGALVTNDPVVANQVATKNYVDTTAMASFEAGAGLEKSGGGTTIVDGDTLIVKDLGITEGKLADDAVTLAKMAGGVDGNLISYDSNGDPVAVATGTAAQVLTSNGVGTAPTFQDAAGGGDLQRVRAVKTSNLALSANVITVIVFNSAAINVGTQYSTSTGKFTATEPGVYMAQVLGTIDAGATAACEVFIRKNAGITTGNRFIRESSGDVSGHDSDLFTLNGTTDYIDFAARCTSSGTFTSAGTSGNGLNMSIIKVGE